MNVKIHIWRILDLNRFVKVTDRFFIFLYSMAAKTKAVLNPSISFAIWKLEGFSEVVFRVDVVFRPILWNPSVKVRLWSWLKKDWLVEILDGKIVIAHVLKNNSSLQVDFMKL